MKVPSAWLIKLKAAELHKVAVAIGTPCSGTKAVQIQGIEHALANLPNPSNHDLPNTKNTQKNLRIVSIDMGIRNLAYSYWTTDFNLRTSTSPSRLINPVLQAWRKINISTSLSDSGWKVTTSSKSNTRARGEADIKASASKETFEPLDYANRAHDFVKTVLAEHKPTHVLIERQRFRSGGNSAVQEWTIRVGVFEGMLYACLKSLTTNPSLYGNLSAEPVLPARVNRYWLEAFHGADHPGQQSSRATKSTAREVKTLKIELVRKFLESIRDNDDGKLFTVDEEVSEMARAFAEKRKGAKRAAGDKSALLEISKLDDLADCFLQGLAWIHWQNNRFLLDAVQHDALALMSTGFSQKQLLVAAS